METKQSRMKSPVVWASLAGLFALICKSWFAWEIPNFNEIVTAAIALLVGFGILNNPTEAEKF